MTTPSLTLPSSPSSFWRNKNWLSSPTHRTPLIWHPVILPISKNETEAQRTPVWYHWGDPGRIAECLTLWQKWTSRKRCKNGGEGGTGDYMREETATDRPYGEFYDFYSFSPEYFGLILLFPLILNVG
jgi:hypothetical protein